MGGKILTRDDVASALRSELPAYLTRMRSILREETRLPWMRVFCGSGTLVSIRVEEGAMDLDAAKSLREYLNIWIEYAERATARTSSEGAEPNGNESATEPETTLVNPTKEHAP